MAHIYKITGIGYALTREDANELAAAMNYRNINVKTKRLPLADVPNQSELLDDLTETLGEFIERRMREAEAREVPDDDTGQTGDTAQGETQYERSGE